MDGLGRVSKLMVHIMSKTSIQCPKFGTKIDLDETLYHKFEEEIRRKFKGEAYKADHKTITEIFKEHICCDDAIAFEVIATLKNEYQPEVMRVVFKDASFVDDVVKTNAIQILKQHGIYSVKSV